LLVSRCATTRQGLGRLSAQVRDPRGRRREPLDGGVVDRVGDGGATPTSRTAPRPDAERIQQRAGLGDEVGPRSRRCRRLTDAGIPQGGVKKPPKRLSTLGPPAVAPLETPHQPPGPGWPGTETGRRGRSPPPLTPGAPGYAGSASIRTSTKWRMKLNEVKPGTRASRSPPPLPGVLSRTSGVWPGSEREGLDLDRWTFLWRRPPRQHSGFGVATPSRLRSSRSAGVGQPGGRCGAPRYAVRC